VKTIVLSIVVICALAVAGIGGTLAGWSDTEESMGNYISTGSLDLKVERTDDLPWGTGLPVITSFTDIVPCYDYKSNVVVENHGQAVAPPEHGSANLTAPLYIRLKDYLCENVNPTCGPGYEWPETTGVMKPEPELVSEFGGVLAQVNILGDNVTDGNWSVGDTGFNASWPQIDAFGQTGDINCSLKSRIQLTIEFGPYGAAPTNVIGPHYMEWWKDKQVYLGELPQCGDDYTIGFTYHMTNLEDGSFPNWPEKFGGWKTNAWMKDRINFNVMFELLDYNFDDIPNRGALP
jgi:predicted ribosomally synthesized peptide with SipW-like signal peptide